MTVFCFGRGFIVYSLFLVLSILLCYITIVQSVEVAISEGKLSGLTLPSRNGNNRYFAFYSIPFAKPPIGRLRFKPPQEPEKWNGVRDSTQPAPICIQNMAEIIGQEDCLYLNVFTEKLNGSVPVIVYIHGGGFTIGSGSFHTPEYFMDYGRIVFVSLNYRLGIFGFLSSGDDILPGNNGMKDQVMALKWVKKNIAAFGGDPNNVMIIGHSSGGCSVHFHMYSQMSKGLFNKAVSLSGTAVSPAAYRPPKVMSNYFKAVSVLSGCLLADNSEIVQCLRSVSAKNLIEIHSKLFTWLYDPGVIFAPTAEARCGPDAFLCKKPREGEELNPGEIPWITGVTSGEGIFRIYDFVKNNATKFEELNDNYKRLLPLVTFYCFAVDDSDSSSGLTEYLRRTYFQNRQISFETSKEFADLIGDSYFILPAVAAVSSYKGKKYLYYFSYKSSRAQAVNFGNLRDGPETVTHAEELTHLFEYYVGEFHYKNQTDVDDIKLSEKLIKMFISFAYTGDPNTDSLENLKWNPVQDANLQYLHIENDAILMDSKVYRSKRQILDNVRVYINKNSE